MDCIQLFGPFGSGTNLLVKILIQNINDNIKIHSEGQTHIWKHTIKKNFLEKCIKNNKNTLFICLYKPLYNWIASMKKHSYDIKWNNNITSPCAFKEMQYENIIAIYNSYYNNYKYLIKKYENVICINYYKLLDVNTVKQYINNKLKSFKLALKSNDNIIAILNKPSKCHGKSVKNIKEALLLKEKLENELDNTDEKNLMDKMIDNSFVEFFNKQ